MFESHPTIPRFWRTRSQNLDLSSPKVMGILNVTPDSFSDGGHHLEPAEAVERALHIQEEGADLLDLGAESSRPGATPVSPELEWQRLRPVLENLQSKLKIPLSLDTRHSETLARALDFGVEILNDVS